MGGYSDVYSDLYDPAFPQTPLDLRTELLLGGVWTDISKKVYYRDGVTIVRGHPDESSAVMPSTSAMTLDNRGGPFSPRNPNGIYYGLIGRNTPLRQSLPEGASYLRSETDTSSYASCPNAASLGVTGDLEVQIDVTLTHYAACVLAAKYTTAGNQRSWSLLFNADATLSFVWSVDGGNVNAHSATTTLPIPPPVLGRFAVKATLSVATGTVTFYTANSISGSWTQLGAASVLGSVTSVFASTSPITVGYAPSYAAVGVLGYTGKIHALKLLNGIGGSIVANPDFTAQVAGTNAFQDGHANLWTLAGNAEISDRKYRIHGEVTAWPPRWDETGSDVNAPIQANGLLRRLGQGTPPTDSAFYRAVVRATGTDSSGNSLVPLAYWPCEDGSKSATLAAAIGVTPIQLTGTPNLASFSGFVCSQAIPTIANSSWTALPASYAGATPTVNCVKFLLAVPSGGGLNNNVIMRLYTTGTVARLDLVYTTGGNISLNAYSAGGATLAALGPFAAGVDGQILLAALILAKDGSGVDVSFDSINITNIAGIGGVGGTVASAVVGQISQVIVNPALGNDSTALGHIAVGVSNDLSNYANPFAAWEFEPAGARVARLCGEEGIACRIIGPLGSIVQRSLADTAQMGVQTPQAFVSLLQECEDADRGLLFEPRQVLGLGYRTRQSLLNQSAGVSLSYTGAQFSPPMEPTDDDQYLTNDVTVARTSDGSSSRQVLTAGALSIQPPPNGVGRYSTAPPSVNVGTDAQLDQQAGWLLHLGTVDELRHPAVDVDLSRSEVAGQYYQLQDLDIGDRLAGANTPAWLPPDGISQLLRGQTETCYSFTHKEEFVCVPESPYRVGVYDDAVLGHYDTDGSTLQGGYSSTAMALLVATTGANSPLWTTAAGDFPFDVEVGGERMTVTNITGSSSPQTFTVTRSVNGIVKAQTDGTAVSLFQPAVYSM